MTGVTGYCRRRVRSAYYVVASSLSPPVALDRYRQSILSSTQDNLGLWMKGEYLDGVQRCQLIRRSIDHSLLSADNGLNTLTRYTSWKEARGSVGADSCRGSHHIAGLAEHFAAESHTENAGQPQLSTAAPHALPPLSVYPSGCGSLSPSCAHASIHRRPALVHMTYVPSRRVTSDYYQVLYYLLPPSSRAPTSHI